jgi:superfamily II DNA or RNA helicase
MITLFKHQDKLVNKRIKRAFKQGHKKLLVQSPTGSGKTIMFSYISKKTSEKNNKVLILTDRIELLSQAGGTLSKFEMTPSLIKAGSKYIDKSKKVFVAMSQTLRNRLKDPVWFNFIRNEINLIVIDEAHAQEFNHIFETKGLLDKCRVLGFTATPVRTGKMTQLGLQYDALINGTSIVKLIKGGYLVNCDIYDCGAPDLSGVAVNRMKGDFAEGSMFKQYDNAKLYKGLTKNYLKHTPGQKMIVFCCNVEHAIKTTLELNKAGVKAKFICSGKTAPKVPKKWTETSKAIYEEKLRGFEIFNQHYYNLSGPRKKIFDDFNANDFEVLVNVDIATKGFDCPDIKVVALYRATTSLSLYLQMIGRGSRTAKDKTHFTVFDFGGNKSRFGGYDLDRNWSLWHEESKSEGGAPPMKVCGLDSKENEIKGSGSIKKGCERIILASYKMCPFCAFKYPEKNKAKEIELQLEEIVDENGVSIKKKSFSEMSFSELTQYREIKKHHIRWLYRQLWSRNKTETINAYAKEYGWSSKRIYYVLNDLKEKS